MENLINRSAILLFSTKMNNTQYTGILHINEGPKQSNPSKQTNEHLPSVSPPKSRKIN